MLADAVGSESYKLVRNYGALFWGFCAAPLGVLGFNLFFATYLAMRNSGVSTALRLSAGFAGKIELGPQIIHGLSLGGSSFVQIFYITGAAALFAGEYRWETWRLLVPRNSRFNLLAAKFIVYALASAISLIGLGAVEALLGLYNSVLIGIPPAGLSLGFAPEALNVFLASWAELLVMGAFTALVAVTTRSMMGALLTGIFFSFAQGVGMAVVHPWEAPLRDFAYLPSMSAYLLRAWASGSEIAPGVMADPAKLVPAALFLLAWIGLLAGAAAAWFQGQDLSRE
jgi:ABC-2 type transport system permease protein